MLPAGGVPPRRSSLPIVVPGRRGSATLSSVHARSDAFRRCTADRTATAERSRSGAHHYAQERTVLRCARDTRATILVPFIPQPRRRRSLSGGGCRTHKIEVGRARRTSRTVRWSIWRAFKPRRATPRALRVGTIGPFWPTHWPWLRHQCLACHFHYRRIEGRPGAERGEPCGLCAILATLLRTCHRCT